MIMKKQLKFWSMMMLVIMVIPLLVACGDDGDGPGNKNGQTTLVDGVNVNKRKMLTLDVNYGDNNIGSYKMSYDSKGKLTGITFKDYRRSNINWGIRIDYDLCAIEYINDYTYKYNSQDKSYTYEPIYAKSRFALNDRGFISQIANCECTYNSEGYLTEVKTIADWWTFAYNNGDVVKAMVEVFKSGNMDLYYVYYGDKANEGELYFTCKELEFSDIGTKFHRSIMIMIAYHAGLFGNISKHCTMLPNSVDAKTFIELSSWDNYNKKSEDMTFACKFTFSD